MADPPPDLIPVQLAKGCLLLVTARECLAGIRRGKWWRRATANARRDASQQPTAPTP